MSNDLRYLSIKSRLSKLSVNQLRSIIENDCVYDTYNYDGASHRFCPLAVALEVPAELNKRGLNPSQEIVRSILESEYSDIFDTVRGIPGEFYRGSEQERKSDINALCAELINEKLKGI